MKVLCEQPNLDPVEGIPTFATAFRDGSGYVLIQFRGAAGDEDWIGSDHYVEVNDQLHGAFGGIRSMVVTETSLTLTLSGPANLFAEPMELVFAEPLAENALKMLDLARQQR